MRQTKGLFPMRKLVVGLILGLGMSMFPVAAHADTAATAEAAFVAKINTLRAGKGLPTLEVHPNLVAKARAWAEGMAAAGRIWHSTLSDGITADWKKLGENVGMGGSVDGLHDAFVASPHHYENLVDPSFGYVGIGIVMNGNTMYVSEVFMELMATKTANVVTSAHDGTTAAPKPATGPQPRPCRRRRSPWPLRKPAVRRPRRPRHPHRRPPPLRPPRLRPPSRPLPRFRPGRRRRSSSRSWSGSAPSTPSGLPGDTPAPARGASHPSTESGTV